MRIHFVGCEGASMKVLRALAESEGLETSGSDLRLMGHGEKFAEGADLIVYSSAVGEDNPELIYGREHGAEILTRAEYLGRVAAKYSSTIAVAGSHGKTTVTAMLGCIFEPYDPTVHLGGVYRGECGRVGGKRFFITEACEYRRNFLHLRPKITAVLNVELDHTDYYRDLADITSAFDVFSRSAPVRILSGDDSGSAPLRTGKFVTFGVGSECDYRAENIELSERGSRFTLWVRGTRACEIELGVKGRHNAIDALAAAAVALEAGVRIEDIKRGLKSFEGVARRLERVGSVGNCAVYTDYAHHPREIESTLSSLRDSGYEWVGVVFEPHTYSRTRALMNDFAASLLPADEIFLADVYAAREKAEAGVSSQHLCRKILERGGRARCFCTYFELNEAVKKSIKKGAVCYCGAGTVDIAAKRLAEWGERVRG